MEAEWVEVRRNRKKRGESSAIMKIPSTTNLHNIESVTQCIDHILRTFKYDTGSTLRSLHPKSVILYGSVATGQNTFQSDVDIMIVWPARLIPPDEALIELKQALISKCGTSVDLVVMAYIGKECIPNVNDEPYIENVKRDGKIIIGDSIDIIDRSYKVCKVKL